MSHRPFVRYAAAVALSAAFLPSVATAQLGRLKKAAADAAKEAAGVKEPEAKNNNSGSNFVITSDRLAAVIAVMTPMMTDAEREQASRAVAADYSKKRKAYDSCIETQTKAMPNGGMPSPDGLQRSAKISQVSVEQMQRSLAAQQNKRHREFLALQDSMVATGTAASLAMFNLDSKCGAYPYKPAAMLDLDASKMARAGSGEVGENGKEKSLIPPANRAGMTTYQWGMIRERAALWALQQTNNAPVGNNKYGIFTAEEQGVLEAQGATLKKWAPFFKDQPSLWATWADITAW